MRALRCPAHVPKLVLRGSDIQIIAERLSTLLADWYWDSVIDLRRPGKPRVWVRSTATNGFDRPAVGFERGKNWPAITVARLPKI